MAEAGDAVQLVIAAARGGYLLAKGSYLLLLKMLQLTQALYYSNWAGSVKYKKLIKMKGPDLVFLNAGTEDPAVLAAIEKNMEDHGVLFARLPDLCGGDGRTQYAIGSDDVAKLRAVLLDHANSKHKDIRFGPISEAEYLHTGIGPDGKENEELRRMRESARENVKAQVKDEPGKAETQTKTMGERTQTEPGHAKDQAKSWNPKYHARAETGKDYTSPGNPNTDKEPETRQDPAARRNLADTPDIQKQRLKETFRDPRIRMRELDAKGRSADYVFLPGEPISRNGRFFEFELDKDNSIFIPVGDALVAENQAKYGPSEKHGAVLFKSNTYTTVQRKTRSFQKLSGKKALLWVTKGVLQKTGQEISKGAQSLDAPQQKVPSSGVEVPKETVPKETVPTAAVPKAAPKKML